MLKVKKDGEGNAKVKVFKYDPTVTREMISNMIIVHEYSFSYVEHE